MFLIVLAVVWEVGISCRARELKCLVRSQVFWVEKNGGENVYLLCIANSSQRAVFIDAEAKKTSPVDHPDCGYGSSVFSTPANGFLQWHQTVSSLLPATNFTECRKSSVILNMAFMAKHTLF